MTITLNILLIVSIGLIIKFADDCRRKEKEIRDITASWSRKSDEYNETIGSQSQVINDLDNQVSNYKKMIDELRHTIKIRTERSIKAIHKKDIYETALQKINEKHYIWYGTPTAPYATFIPPYEIAQKALKEAQS